jgi:hypothetical protein
MSAYLYRNYGSDALAEGANAGATNAAGGNSSNSSAGVSASVPGSNKAAVEYNSIENLISFYVSTH